MNEKTKYFTAILYSAVGLLAFTACHYLSYTLLNFLVKVLWDVPVVGSFLNLLFSGSADSLNLLLSVICPMIAYGGTLFLLALINKQESSFRLSCEITGVVIMCFHIASGVFNYTAGESLLTNITQFIAGYMLFTGRK